MAKLYTSTEVNEINNEIKKALAELAQLRYILDTVHITKENRYTMNICKTKVTLVRNCLLLALNWLPDAEESE